MAREHGIDLEELRDKGTGVGGRITKRDIQSYLEQRGEEKPTARVDSERVPMTAMRKSIAEHMRDSKRTSAHVATVFEVDCSALLKARDELKAEFQRSGVNLTVTPFFVQAAARADSEVSDYQRIRRRRRHHLQEGGQHRNCCGVGRGFDRTGGPESR